MKINAPKILTTFLCLTTSYAFSQFNTIKPSVPLKKNSETPVVNLKNNEPNENDAHKKEKKTLKKIFGITSKSDLKSEIDSLKTMLKEFTSYNSQKWDIQNTKDSLLLAHQAKYSLAKKTYSKLIIDESKKADISKVVMPLNGTMQITSGFGTRVHPIFGIRRMHNGIDLKANYENVYSVMDGIVSASGWDPNGGGKFIKVNHFNRFETSYLHLSEVYYKVGEKVNAGFVIAKSGNTGNSTGSHLHFAVKEYGRSIDPQFFLKDLVNVNNLIAIYNEQQPTNRTIENVWDYRSR